MTPAFTVWFTGMSGSGKSTIASAVVEDLRARDLPVVLLDGDEVRRGISTDLGFSRADRDTQVRRVGWICDLLTRSGVVAVAALVSPYRATRDEVRARVGRFVEVYVEAPVEVLRERDTKGLYRLAGAGDMTGLTGIDDPYEPPERPEVRCTSDGSESPSTSAARVVAELGALGYLADRPMQRESSTTGYSESEESHVHDRLAELGYL